MIKPYETSSRFGVIFKASTSLLLFLSLTLVYLIPASSVSVAASDDTAMQMKQDYQQAIEDWAYVLKTYVDDQGRTNFQALSQDIGPLENVVSMIGAVSPSKTPALFPTKESVLAYHINSYNALAMFGVIERGIPDGFTSFFSRASFFKFRDVVIGGDVTNLYDYENDVIRPLNEPRVHFALNCMVKDCPRLPQEPFYADTLNGVLETLTTEFFAKPKHFYLDHKAKRAYVSEILDFYTEDFVDSGKARDLPQYINRYLSSPIPNDYKVRFIDYDWHINATDTVNALSFKNESEEKNEGDIERDSEEKAITLYSSTSPTTVLEVYTSQGCSSCPPAEKWLSSMTDNDMLWESLVPINFHVDYWDYLGWKDPFANKAFSVRQRDYKRVGKSNTVGTPGFALNGKGWNGWFRGQPIPRSVPKLAGQLEAEVAKSVIDTHYVQAQGVSENSDLIAHAALLGFGIKTSVKRGENANRLLKHDFVVIDYVNTPMSVLQGNHGASLPVPENDDVATTKRALVVWVSTRHDPTPLQVAADWY